MHARGSVLDSDIGQLAPFDEKRGAFDSGGDCESHSA
jgi:hypothetical protein